MVKLKGGQEGRCGSYGRAPPECIPDTQGEGLDANEWLEDNLEPSKELREIQERHIRRSGHSIQEPDAFNSLPRREG